MCTLLCLPIADKTDDIFFRFGDEKKRWLLHWMRELRFEKSEQVERMVGEQLSKFNEGEH